MAATTSKKLHTSRPNPFAALKGPAFAADLPLVRHDFKLLGKDCFVELRPMDAGAAADLASMAAPLFVAIQTGARSEGGFDASKLQLDIAEFQAELLLGTLVDFALPRKAHGEQDGKAVEVTELTLGRGLTEAQKREVFRTLTQELGQVLVTEAAEVNALDPLLRGLLGVMEASTGPPASESASPGSETTTESGLPASP